MTDDDTVRATLKAGLHYRDCLKAVAKAVPCTFDDAARIVKNLALQGWYVDSDAP